jgi:hypothetical protein
MPGFPVLSIFQYAIRSADFNREELPAATRKAEARTLAEIGRGKGFMRGKYQARKGCIQRQRIRIWELILDKGWREELNTKG